MSVRDSTVGCSVIFPAESADEKICAGYYVLVRTSERDMVDRGLAGVIADKHIRMQTAAACL